VKYIAKGTDLDQNKLAKAIELSESKFCVVSQTIESQAEVQTSFEILSG